MAEYIDRDTLLKSIDVTFGNYKHDIVKLYSDVRTAVIYTPAVDVAPVKHGKWIAIKNPYGEIEGWMHEDCGRQSDEVCKYCPNCGAKMG